ncbi:hypothetical protein GQ457_07G045280 [Hibiscus cannabinus]
MDDVSVVNHWLVNWKHYEKTSEEWLKRMDKNLATIKPTMESTYGKDQAVKMDCLSANVLYRCCDALWMK